jgi:hypothetical protein
MEFGMNTTQMVELFNKILIKDNKAEFDEILDQAVEGKDDQEDRIVALLCSYSRVVLPTAVFRVIEANNQMISTQIEAVLAHTMVVSKKQK